MTTKVNASWTKKEYTKGEYKETTIDKEKKEVEFLLQAIDGCYYTIWMNTPIELPKGAKIYNEKVASIKGERTFKAFAKVHTWTTDF